MRAAYLFFGLAGGLTLVACAGILGIDDRSPDTQGTGDGSTGDAGPGDDGGTGGPDGTAGGDGAMPGADGGTPGDAASCPDPCVYAKGLNHPFWVTSDAKNVYWTEFGDDVGSGNGYVKSCPVAGCGNGPTVLATGLTNPRGLVVDGQSVYFGTGTYSAVSGGIWSCPLAGCNGSPRALAPAGIPYGLAQDATYVYWVDNDDATVHRVAKAGTGGDHVLYDAGSGIVVEPTNCAVDPSSVFLTDWNGDVYRMPIAGGEPATIASWSYGGVWPLALDTSNVYYGAPGGVFRVPKAGGVDGGTPLATGIADPDGLVIDDAGVLYWSNWGSSGDDGTIGKVHGDGTAAATIAASQQTPESVTLSGGYVFWLTSGTPDSMGNPMPSTGTLVRNAR